MYNFIFLCLLMFTIIPFAFIPIWLVFKHTKRVEWRILSISFFIPFVNLVWFLIEGEWCPDYFVLLSEISGFLWLFLILPVLFLIILCIPKKVWIIKWKALLTVFLIYVMGWILIALTIFGLNVYNKIFPEPSTSYFNPITLNRLKDYDVAIDYVEDYKNKNGFYPKNIDKLNIKSKNYPFYNYKTYNNDKDYILIVNESETYAKDEFYGFRYCSSADLPDCKAIGHKSDNGFLKIGKWVHIFYFD